MSQVASTENSLYFVITVVNQVTNGTTRKMKLLFKRLSQKPCRVFC